MRRRHRKTQPKFLQEGTEVRAVFHPLHHDPDIWGADSLEFRPERWENLRTSWEYMSFLACGRTCQAQQMILTKCSYILVRFLREFRHIENRDEKVEFVESIKMSLESSKGVKVITLAIVERANGESNYST
ncbi:hypothetical protein BJ878DRAFT_324341 [Calycina marina]|uniref:Cytochrome P450 n=1 Tax=Calycina marina TaxID=1763456 RepID=A0A9P8CGJ9_9HELO|nr:hypothetical protein BJ878DRAFT_324341 [Calycina marina]